MKIPQKIMTLAVAALMGSNITANADPKKETNSEDSKTSFIGVSIGGGISTFNFTGINNILLSQGIPQLKETQPSYMLGFTVPLGDDVPYFLDVNLVGQYAKRTTGLITIKQQSSMVDLNFNYNFLNNDSRHRLYAGAGFGLWAMTVTLNKAMAFPSFAQAVGSFSGERTLNSNYNFYGNLKAGYDYAIDKNRKFLIGVSGMYRVGISNKEWKVGPSSATYNANPTQSATGFTGLVTLTVK